MTKVSDPLNLWYRLWLDIDRAKKLCQTEEEHKYRAVAEHCINKLSDLWGVRTPDHMALRTKKLTSSKSVNAPYGYFYLPDGSKLPITEEDHKLHLQMEKEQSAQTTPNTIPDIEIENDITENDIIESNWHAIERRKANNTYDAARDPFIVPGTKEHNWLQERNAEPEAPEPDASEPTAEEWGAMLIPPMPPIKP